MLSTDWKHNSCQGLNIAPNIQVSFASLTVVISHWCTHTHSLSLSTGFKLQGFYLKSIIILHFSLLFISPSLFWEWEERNPAFYWGHSIPPQILLFHANRCTSNTWKQPTKAYSSQGLILTHTPDLRKVLSPLYNVYIGLFV